MEDVLLTLIFDVCDLIVMNNSNMYIKDFEAVCEKWSSSPQCINICMTILEKYRNDFILISCLGVLKKEMIRQNIKFPADNVKHMIETMVGMIQNFYYCRIHMPVINPLIHTLGFIMRSCWDKLSVKYLDRVIFDEFISQKYVIHSGENIAKSTTNGPNLTLIFFNIILSDYSHQLNDFEFIDEISLEFFNEFQSNYLTNLFIYLLKTMNEETDDRSVVFLILDGFNSIFNWNFKRCQQKLCYIMTGTYRTGFSPPINWSDIILRETIIVSFFKCSLKSMHDPEIFDLCISCITSMCFLKGPIAQFRSAVDSILGSVINIYFTLHTKFDLNLPHVSWRLSFLFYKLLISNVYRGSHITFDMYNMCDIFINVYKQLISSRVKECHLCLCVDSEGNNRPIYDEMIFRDSIDNILYGLIHFAICMDTTKIELNSINYECITNLMYTCGILTIQSVLYEPFGPIPSNTIEVTQLKNAISINECIIDYLNIHDLSPLIMYNYETFMSEMCALMINASSTFYKCYNEFYEELCTNNRNAMHVSAYNLCRIMLLASELLLISDDGPSNKSIQNMDIFYSSSNIDSSTMPNNDELIMDSMISYIKNEAHPIEIMLINFHEIINNNTIRLFDIREILQNQQIPIQLQLIVCILRTGFNILMIGTDNGKSVNDIPILEMELCWLHLCKNLIRTFRYIPRFDKKNITLLGLFFSREDYIALSIFNEHIMSITSMIFRYKNNKEPLKITLIFELLVESFRFHLSYSISSQNTLYHTVEFINTIIHKCLDCDDTIIIKTLGLFYKSCIEFNYIGALDNFIQNIYNINIDFMENYLKLPKISTMNLVRTILPINYTLVTSKFDHPIFYSITEYFLNNMFPYLSGIMQHISPQYLECSYTILQLFKRILMSFQNDVNLPIFKIVGLTTNLDDIINNFIIDYISSLTEYSIVWKKNDENTYYTSILCCIDTLMKFTQYIDLKCKDKSNPIFFNQMIQIIVYGLKIIATNEDDIHDLILQYLQFLAFYSKSYPSYFINVDLLNSTIIFSCLKHGFGHYDSDVLIQSYCVYNDILGIICNTKSNNVSPFSMSNKHMINYVNIVRFNDHIKEISNVIYDRMWTQLLVSELNSQLGILIYSLFIFDNTCRQKFFDDIEKFFSINHTNIPECLLDKISVIYDFTSKTNLDDECYSTTNQFTNALTFVIKYIGCVPS